MKPYREDWDLNTIPWEILNSHYQRVRGARAIGAGRKRACGHTKWVKSCELCVANYKRTARRRAAEARALEPQPLRAK
jgi:hypothetical protein